MHIHLSNPSDKPIYDQSLLFVCQREKISVMTKKRAYTVLERDGFGEPTNRLDPIFRDEILDLFLEFKQDKTDSIFSFHILRVI